jgi:hypothetical protein
MPLEVGFSAERLARVRERAIREAGRRQPKGEIRGGDGHLEYRFPLEACLNAVQQGETLSPEYLRDMAKRYPEARVKYTPRRCQVSGVRCQGGGGGAGRGSLAEAQRRGAGRLTQWGRVTFHRSYGDG